MPPPEEFFFGDFDFDPLAPRRPEDWPPPG